MSFFSIAQCFLGQEKYFLYCIPQHVTIKTVTLLLIWQKPCEYVLPNQIQTFMKRTAYNWIIATVFGAATLFSCHTQTALQDKKPQAKIMGHKQNHELAHIPLPPDYNDPNMWTIRDNDQEGTGADVFYVVSTWEQDWMTNDSTICHYADVHNPVHRQRMGIEINGVADYMAPGNRFFAPFYRHMTIDGWITQNEDTIHRRTRISMGDVCNAFDHFIQQRDPSRPLIIAGFSQGGQAVVELLKHMSDSTYQQLAAAYVMGFKVTPEDTALCSHIKPAQGESDTGVTICYNTVKDVKYVKPVVSATCFGINPVNWRTDETPALLHDTVTVSLSPSHHVLVVSGYSGSEYKPFRNFINVGDIHSCEPWLYKECLQRNFHVRAQAWRKTHQSLSR